MEGVVGIENGGQVAAGGRAEVATNGLAASVPPNLFVVPAFNEEDNLPRLFATLEQRPALFPAGSALFVVDDGSADATPQLVAAYEGPLPVELVRLDRNQGPGAAFRAGFEAVRERAQQTGAPDALVITLEADNTCDLDAVPRMIERAHADADVVLASWVMVNVPLARRLLSAGAGAFVRGLLGVDAKTVSSFLRVYRVAALERVTKRHGADLIRESGFACKAEILAKLAAIGATIEEVPVDLDTSKRVGKSKMPIFRTFVAYWRMAVRQRFARGATPA